MAGVSRCLNTIILQSFSQELNYNVFLNSYDLLIC